MPTQADRNQRQVDAPWPFVGREAERELVTQRFGSPSPRSVVLLAPSGVGKSHMLRVLRRDAAAAGIDVVAVHGVQANPAVALAPFLPLLPADAPRELDVASLYRVVVSQLKRIGPTLIAVDDAHLLDDVSAAVVNAIGASQSALVVATVRSDLESPRAIRALWEDDLVDQVTLESLDAKETATVLEIALGGPITDEVAEEIWRLSQGLPLYVHELVRDGLATGAFHDVGGGWSLAGRLAPSARVHDLVNRRLEALAPEQLDVVNLLALRDRVGISVLRQIASSETVAVLEQRGLVLVSTDGRRQDATLAHPIFGEVLRPLLPAGQRGYLLDRLAIGLTDTGARRVTDAIQIVMCRLDGGQTVAPDELGEAAEQALALYDYNVAEALARAGTEQGDHRCAMALYRALNGQRREAEADAELVAALARSRDPDERASAHLAAAAVQLQQRRDPEAALSHQSAGFAEFPSSGLQAQLELQQVIIDFILGRIRSAREGAERLLDGVDMPPVAHSSLEFHLAGIEMYRANIECSLRHIETARGIQEASGVRGWLDSERIDFCEVICRSVRFEVAGALETAQANVATARSHGDEGVSIALLGLQFVGWVGGHLGLARDSSQSWAKSIGASSDRMTDEAGRLFSALVASDLGDFEAFERELSEGLDSTPHNTEPVRHLALSRRERQAGNPDAALGVLQAGIEQALDVENLLFGALLAREMTIIGEPEVARDALHTITSLTPERWVGDLWREQADLFAQREDTGLAALADRFGGAGYLLDAANTAAMAASVTPSPARRFVQRERSLNWLGATQGGVCPLLNNVGSPVSEREREMLALAGAGMTNRAIGGAAGLSPRTVANHLHRSYQKLGVGREDLVQIFEEIDATT